ncbi:MAG: DNA-processing protein DprA, partial [Chitinophagaceae bacterium]|nr:DNA-processing protein DprA [Chitinophagaceae bacterium]
MLHPQDETYYQIALSLAQGIGAKTANALIAHFGSAQAVLAAPRKTLLQIDGFGALRVNALQDKAIFEAAEKEMNFNLVNKVQVLTQADEAYPQRLLHCVDAPQILYYKGNATLNSAKTIAIVGTRKNTEYGQRLCNDLVESLAATPELCIISGLAHGIDTIAHKAALRHQLPTVGVMANGLHMIYPAANKNLAAEMLLNGGLLTEFASIAKLDKGNFPSRNRIVAGIADAIVVVESD